MRQSAVVPARRGNLWAADLAKQRTGSYQAGMDPMPQPGQIAVIFTSRRTAGDDEGYAAAAEAMDRLAAAQPGYAGIVSTRGADGFGITISYWVDEASAIAWRDQADHAATRAQGRARWYADYEVVVAKVARGYRWAR